MCLYVMVNTVFVYPARVTDRMFYGGVVAEM